MIFLTFGVDLQGSSAVAVGVGEHGVCGPQSAPPAPPAAPHSAGLPVPSNSSTYFLI